MKLIQGPGDRDMVAAKFPSETDLEGVLGGVKKLEASSAGAVEGREVLLLSLRGEEVWKKSGSERIEDIGVRGLCGVSC